MRIWASVFALKYKRIYLPNVWRDDKTGGQIVKTKLDLIKEVFDSSLQEAIRQVESAKERLDLIREAHKKDQEATQRWSQKIEEEMGI